MDGIRITLFGRFQVHSSGETPTHLNNRKVQELLVYLLLHRGQPHHREHLATVIWENATGTQSRNYLRKAIWQLQSALSALEADSSEGMLQVTDEWIGINPQAEIDLDVARFEEAFALTQDLRGSEIPPAARRAVEDAIQRYRGSLLEGWYQDWCLFERERLQQLYFVMLDKLMDCCEAHQEWERGVMYGSLILRCDIARERTHRRLMRLYYLARDRTGALRQFERCQDALQTELGVAPSRQTLSLYHQIRRDQIPALKPETSRSPELFLPNTLEELEALNSALAQVQRQVNHRIKVIEALINGSSQAPI